MLNDFESSLARALQARRENRLDDARQDLAEAVEGCRKSGVPLNLARALTALGQIERDLGRVDVAVRHYEEAAAIYRAEGDPLKLAHTVRHLGDMHRGQGRTDLAAPHYDEALALYRGHDETPPLDLANAIRGAALLKDDIHRSDEAMLLWAEAKDLYAGAGVQAGVAECSRRLARKISSTLPSSQSG